MARLFESDESSANDRGRHLETRSSRSSRVQNPVTPIPRRASAPSVGVVRVRPKYSHSYTNSQDEDITRIPTTPRSATWQDEAIEDEEAADIPELFVPSHLMSVRFPIDMPEAPQNTRTSIRFPIEIEESSPSMRVSAQFPVEIGELFQASNPVLRFPIDMPEAPQNIKTGIRFPIEIEEPAPSMRADAQFLVEVEEVPRHTKTNMQFPMDISELTTNPPPALLQSHHRLAANNEYSLVLLDIDAVVEADTLLSDALSMVPSLSMDIDMYPTSVEDVVDIALTARARELMRRKKMLKGDRPAFIQDPWDYMRWWLLCPGRLEFLFWFGGALLLGAIMCVLLIMTGLGLGFMSFGHVTH